MAGGARRAIQPAAQLAQVGGGRHLAGGEGLALKQQGRAGRADRLQQGMGVVEQRGPPVALARDRLDHPLLQPADRELRLGLDEAFEGGEPGADRLGQQVGGGADAVGGQPRRVMVAGDQAPEPAADHQRGDQRRRHAHVLQVLHMHRRDAAEDAERHVQLLARQGREARDQRHRRIADIGRDPHPVALIEAAGDLRDVGRGVAVAEIGLELRAAVLGDHLAMAFVVEAVDHHPVVAGDLPEQPRRLVAEHPWRIGAEHRLQHALHQSGAVAGLAGGLQLDDEAAAGRAVQGAVEAGRGPAGPAADRGGQGLQRLGEVRRDPLRQVAPQRRQRQAEDTLRQAQQRAGIGAGLHHQPVRLPYQQQGAVRLDRGGEMDLLPLAVREVGLAEARRREGSLREPPVHPVASRAPSGASSMP